MSPDNGRKVCWAIRIRPEIRISNDLFPQGPPSVIYCTVIERRIGSETIDDTWNYHLKKYGGPPGTHTTYHAAHWDVDSEAWLGKYSLFGYPPDSEPPVLRTRLDPDIQYVYNVIILPAPYLPVPPPPPQIAWAKTVNFISDPESWWFYHNYRWELAMEPPPLYVGVFNNFPHPCGPRDGQPPFWPDPDDVCHLDWCKRSLWPEYLDEAEHSDMRLIMLINEWGTWEELFNEHIQTIPPWVQ